MRGTEDVEALAVGQRREIGAAEMVLKPVVGGQADGPDVVIVPGAVKVMLGHVAEGRRRSQGQRGGLRLQWDDAGTQLERLGRGDVAVEAACIARSNRAVQDGSAETPTVDTARCIV